MSFLNQDFGDASDDEEEFNPAPAVASDDEADNNDDNDQRQDDNQDDDDDDAQPNARRSSAQEEDQDDDAAPSRSRANNDDDDEEEDDEDEEDDEEDEEDEDIGHPRKRRRKGPRNQFLDVEAEVDDEDEEEPDEDDEIAGEEMHPDDLLELPAGAERDDRKHRELDRQRDLAASMDAEKQAQALKERYGRNRAANVDSAVVPQRLLLPSVDDPKIWRLKCKPGKEREVVFSIMKRIEDRAGTREPLQLISAFERGGVMAGNLYCEARHVEDVTNALEGLQNVYMGTKPMMVPITEMPDLLRTRKSKSLEPGMYVRVKRGKYAGDLAQIDEVESNGTEVTLRLIPRLDYGLNDDVNAAADNKRKRFGFGSNTGPRPPQRLFSENEARKRHGRYLTKGTGFTANTWTYMNDTYVDGFLIKDYKANHLQSEDVNPTLEEVTKFAADAEDGTENLDLSALAATIKSNSSGAFLPGDHVEIWQGEQRGVVGKAVSVHSDIVRILVSSGELSGQIIESPVKGLRKLFREGDHVKVIGGSKYFDEVGMVVKIVEDRVTILTDSNQTEITVFSKDLRVATDSGGQVGVGKYDLHELVQLDASTVACVIKVDRESLRVLDQTGTVRSLLPSNISNKLERRKNAVATDREGSEIHIDDTVKEEGGEGRQGRVLHIHRNFLFAHNREQTDNAGVFVVRTNNVKTVAAKGGRVASAQAGLMKMNPALQRPGAQQAGAQAMPPPRQMGRDRL
ncbi:transcription elongation factor Spt5, partial [Aureobasidium melanogenum]